MDIIIRDEGPGDVGAIEAVTVAAFWQAAHSSHTEQFIVHGLLVRSSTARRYRHVPPGIQCDVNGQWQPLTNEPSQLRVGADLCDGSLAVV